MQHHLQHFQHQDGQLGQLLLWLAHVWRGDGGGRVLGDGGDDEGQGEADGVVEVEGLVVVED